MIQHTHALCGLGPIHLGCHPFGCGLIGPKVRCEGSAPWSASPYAFFGCGVSGNMRAVNLWLLQGG